jgi:hypothetical protein
MQSFEDNLKTVVGNFVLQSIQFQTLANQLQEQLTDAQAKLKAFEDQSASVKEAEPKLKAVKKD